MLALGRVKWECLRMGKQLWNEMTEEYRKINKRCHVQPWMSTTIRYLYKPVCFSGVFSVYPCNIDGRDFPFLFSAITSIS